MQPDTKMERKNLQRMESEMKDIEKFSENKLEVIEETKKSDIFLFWEKEASGPISTNSNEKLYQKPFPKLKADTGKQKEIIESFKFAWEAYKKYSWGKDFLKPVSKEGTNVFFGGLSITDSLDTLLLLGLSDELEKCKEWIQENFHFDGQYSVFEINIRHFASFLSMYQQTSDKFYLEKAIYVVVN